MKWMRTIAFVTFLTFGTAAMAQSVQSSKPGQQGQPVQSSQSSKPGQQGQPVQSGQSSKPGQSGLESFYGLKLGEKYGERTVLNALLATGIDRRNSHIIKDSIPSFGRLTYSVDGIVLNGVEAQGQVKTAVTVIMSPDNTFEAVILVPEGQEDNPVVFAADNALPELMHFANANVESVENEFFDMKLGSAVNLVSITRAVGDNGLYHSSSIEGKTRVHCFSDVTFDDFVWDYALFSVTPSGKLVAFTVYSVFEGSVKGYHPARRLLIQMRNKYFKKYGFGLPDVDDDEYLDEYVFSGQNGIDQILSEFDTETDRGKDAYCVQMEFVHDALNRELTIK